jgi:ParB family chromosome partitioning protein
VDGVLDVKLPEGLARREERAALLLALDDEIARIVLRLKARGLTSPYLKAFAMARINYLRFVKGDMPPFEKALESLVAKAKKFDPEKVKPQDLAGAGGPPDEES